MNKPLIFIFAVFSMAFAGCTPWLIYKQSLMEQFANGNNLKTITCINRKGHEKIINVTNHTKAIIVGRKENATLHKFYLSTLVLNDSTISGSNSHSINAVMGTSYWKNIKVICIRK